MGREGERGRARPPRRRRAVRGQAGRLPRARLSHDPTRPIALGAAGPQDAPARPDFDERARFVAWLPDVPTAAVSLVEDRPFGPTGARADERGTPIETAFGEQVVTTGRPLIVEDAREHPLLRGNPAIAARDVVAYAGVPLVDADENLLGVLCAIDDKPRLWTEEEIATLHRLAERASGERTRHAP